MNEWLYAPLTNVRPMTADERHSLLKREATASTRRQAPDPGWPGRIRRAPREFRPASARAWRDGERPSTSREPRLLEAARLPIEPSPRTSAAELSLQTAAFFSRRSATCATFS